MTPTICADEPLVVVEDAARTFGRGAAAIVAVHGVDCSVLAGDRIALVGPSGSGKSTLLHLLAGLDVPTAGSISWPALGSATALRPGPIAVVFQAPSLFVALDVVENVELPALLAGSRRDVARRLATAALDALDLRQLERKLPEELSGGQAQRVAIARALAGTPRLILADEPTGQLDHANGTFVLHALIGVADRLGAALVVSTHDPDIARRLLTRWDMRDGRLTVATAPVPTSVTGRS